MIRTAALLAALLLTNPLAAQSLEARFAAPPQTDRPWVRWWWPGGAVDTEELDREIGLLDKSGFAGAEIQAFTPNFITLEPGQRAAVGATALMRTPCSAASRAAQRVNAITPALAAA